MVAAQYGIAHLISTVGLAFDIAGAVWIVKSLLRLSDDEIAAASDRTAAWAGGPERYSPRPALQQLFRESRRDAQIGTVLLVSGFALQLVAVWLR